jgi:hypothetical protein
MRGEKGMGEEGWEKVRDFASEALPMSFSSKCSACKVP